MFARTRVLPLALGLLRFTTATTAQSGIQTSFNLSRNLSSSSPAAIASTRNMTSDFSFKERSEVLTPNDLISLPRPGAGVSNIAGDFLFVPVAQYDSKSNKNLKYLYIYSIGNPSRPLKIELTNGGETFWLSGRSLGYVVPTPSKEDKPVKSSDLYVWDVSHFPSSEEDDQVIKSEDVPATFIGQIPHSEPSNFAYWPKSGHLVFSAYVWEDGVLDNNHDEEYADRGNTALVYDTTYERQWDTWKTPGRKPVLFSVQFYQDPDRKWRLNENGRGFVNIQRSDETHHSTPVEPFGGAEDFAVSENFVVYSTLAPENAKEAAWHTRRDIYITDIKGEGYPKRLTTGKQGAASSPVIEIHETKVAWLEMDEDGYEADRNKIVIYDLTKDIRYTLTPTWDRSPDQLSFGKQGHVLYFTAGDEARVKAYAIPIPPTPQSSSEAIPLKYLTPIALTTTGAASGIQALYTGRLLFTRSSLTSPNDVFKLDGLPHLEKYMASLPEDKTMDFSFSSLVSQQQSSNDPEVEDLAIRQITDFSSTALKGKTLNPGEDFWFEGAEGKKIQGFVVKPAGFKQGEKGKWPAVLLIHGGPQGAWEDQWSTRWNPQVFAGQGYVTIFMNPTGSTTFGQELTDAIAEDWGGKPFVDMQKGWKYILGEYPEIDQERTVAAGASWGGYAINWIQSNPEFEFNFKALVCHDGVFDARYNGFSTDELFFFNHEWGGRPWDPKAKEILEKFNPANFVSKWNTPQLTIHSSKDYRLPETDGIGAFHALQQLGVDSRLLVFPDENHWVLKHGNSLKWHYEVFRWFDKYAG